MYERALNFLTDNEPERRSFQALQEQAHALCGHTKYVIKCPIGIRVLNTLPVTQGSLYIQLHQHSMARQQRPCNLVSETRTGPAVTHAYSSLRYSDDRTVLTVIIEVGVSEGYRELQADIMLPRFRNGGAYSVDERPLFPDAKQQVARVSPFGLYHYRDRSWFGTLDTAHALSITTTTCVTDSSERTGDSVDIGLTLGDVFPVDENAIGDSRTDPVHLETDYLRNVLISGAIDTSQNLIHSFRYFMKHK
ncbi:hypothetical protein V1523DRAFT_441921 [Lipomyces doorenjongii]